MLSVSIPHVRHMRNCDLANNGEWKILPYNLFLHTSKWTTDKEKLKRYLKWISINSSFKISLSYTCCKKWLPGEWVFVAYQYKWFRCNYMFHFLLASSFSLCLLLLPLSLFLTVHWKWFTRTTESQSHSASFQMPINPQNFLPHS